MGTKLSNKFNTEYLYNPVVALLCAIGGGGKSACIAGFRPFEFSASLIKSLFQWKVVFIFNELFLFFIDIFFLFNLDYTFFLLYLRGKEEKKYQRKKKTRFWGCWRLAVFTANATPLRWRRPSCLACQDKTNSATTSPGVRVGLHQDKASNISKIFNTTYYPIYLSTYLLESNLQERRCA